MSSLKSVNTKLEAYKLIHDPVRLLCLLYSKYGDIEEDQNFLYINQLLYDKLSHYNSQFKEYQYMDFTEEFLRRFYFFEESFIRIPKLSDYYKNYHKFFCRPNFRNFKIYEIMHNYGDYKAEIFYKNNLASKNEINESSNKTSLSSLDNVTNNKTIFDKKTRFIIENENNKKNNSNIKYTLTLDSSRNLNNLNLLTKRSKDDSFIDSISPLINYHITKKEIKTQNKTISNPKNIQKNKVSIKSNLQKNIINIKSSLYNLVKTNLNCETIKTQKRNLKSPKLKTYLSNFKSSLEEFNKNKTKYIEKAKMKNKTYNNNNNNLISNFRNFSKLSATLNNNLYNNFNFTNTIKNNSATNNKNLNNHKINHSNTKTKNNNNKITNGSIHNSGSTIQRSKNKTFDVKAFNSMNNLTKFHSNSNFSCFNFQQITIRSNRKKKNCNGSNFNLVKTPLNIVKGNTSKQKVSKNKKYNNIINNNSKNSILSTSSIPKFFNKKDSKNSKEKNNTNHRKKNNISQNNALNLNNILFSIQKNLNNISNGHNILSPKNTIQSNRINLNNIYNASRNKKNMLTHTQTNIKTFRKDILIHKTKSIDEEKKLKNILFNNKKNHNYQMSQRLVNQIEELIKKSKSPFRKYNINNINNNFNNHKKMTIDNSNSSIHNNHSGTSIKLNSNNKTINVNLNMKVNSEDRREKIIRMISPKK